MECRLEQIKEERGFTVTWLSEKSGISRNAIHAYMNGAVPALDKAYAIAKVLNLTVYDIWPQM
ncbi:helix-turn-helix transcriptional regulator [Fodinisporobacter ferrooxydans]|uniref:Helix-turn-helix transcriptional regulator n=1 Tax=Fodinisporobacter ferrooxydans TaxID=2901836 RepID=A0ABY4CLV4_9BACL|nr:helix-turn-helix transcriptional regulator [Alicyclobacillaceae bacterium MYW30-H2]